MLYEYVSPGLSSCESRRGYTKPSAEWSQCSYIILKFMHVQKPLCINRTHLANLPVESIYSLQSEYSNIWFGCIATASKLPQPINHSIPIWLPALANIHRHWKYFATFPHDRCALPSRLTAAQNVGIGYVRWSSTVLKTRVRYKHANKNRREQHDSEEQREWNIKKQKKLWWS
jgi:hypothetical protein